MLYSSLCALINIIIFILGFVFGFYIKEINKPIKTAKENERQKELKEGFQNIINYANRHKGV